MGVAEAGLAQIWVKMRVRGRAGGTGRRPQDGVRCHGLDCSCIFHSCMYRRACRRLFVYGCMYVCLCITAWIVSNTLDKEIVMEYIGLS